MDAQSDNQKRKPLVTVEFQTEVDIATGNREKRMFVKMYFEARDSGLLAALPDELWKTLCCLATYMDENGHCYPSQALLAKSLGISREHINKRIQRLLAFRFNGESVLTMTKNRESRRGGSRWANNVYQLRPISGFAMFEEPTELHNPESRPKTGKPSMLPSDHIELHTSTAPLCDPIWNEPQNLDSWTRTNWTGRPGLSEERLWQGTGASASSSSDKWYWTFWRAARSCAGWHVSTAFHDISSACGSRSTRRGSSMMKWLTPPASRNTRPR